MLQPSSPSVKIRYFDRDGVWRALKKFVRAVAVAHPEVKQVLVFGSLVRGDSVPGSDVDLLFILSHSEEPFLSRIPVFTPSHFPVG